MEQILDRLWLGSMDDAAACAHSLTQMVPMHAILSLNEQGIGVESAITHIHAPIPDEAWLPQSVWSELLHVLCQLLQRRATVLVHCRLGVSRSPALVAAYLAHCGHSQDPATALAYLMARRICICIHGETWRGVLDWWEQQ